MEEKKLSEVLLENLRNIVDVEEDSKEVVKPDFAAAVREIKDADEKRDEANEKVEAPKEGEEALPKSMKLILDESLFEDYDEPTDYIVRVHEDGSSEVQGADEFRIEAEFDELREMTDEELKSHDLIGAAHLYRDDEGIVHVFEITYAEGNRDIVDAEAKKYVTLNPEEAEDNINEGCEKANESYSEDPIEDYLTSVRFDGDGWITVEKIEFDIDQDPNLNVGISDILNRAIEKGWRFVDHPEHGLCIVAKGKEIKEGVEFINRITTPVKEDIKPDMILRTAYAIVEPEEFQLDLIRDDITIEDLWKKMQEGEDFYATASVDGEGFDSAVREGIFNLIEKAMNVPYDDIYDTWLDKKSANKKQVIEGIKRKK